MPTFFIYLKGKGLKKRWKFPQKRGGKPVSHFLDPVGSLVSTLLVGWLLVVGHTFSKFVYFECCSVVMMVY